MAPAASATAGVAGAGAIDLTAEELAPLFDLLAEAGLVDILNDLVSQVEDQLVSEVFTQVHEACTGELEALVEILEVADPLLLLGGLLDALDELSAAGPADLDDLIATLDGLETHLAALYPPTCAVLGDLADVLDGGALADAIDALLSAEGVVEATLLETTSAVGRGSITATAGPAEGGMISVTLSIPGLDELLGDLLSAALAPLVEDLNDVLGDLAVLVTGVDLLDLDQIVADLLDTSELEGLLDGPLLSVGIAPGEESATGDLDTLETSGVSSPALVTLGGAVFSLPLLSGLDEALNTAAAALDDAVLSELAESPLGDLVAVALLPGDVVDDEVDGLPGTRATSGTASVVLLAALVDAFDAPLLIIDVAAAEAAVGVDEVDEVDDGEPVEDVPTTKTPTKTPGGKGPLPTTGGGVGLLALGSRHPRGYGPCARGDVPCTSSLPRAALATWNSQMVRRGLTAPRPARCVGARRRSAPGVPPC